MKKTAVKDLGALETTNNTSHSLLKNKLLWIAAAVLLIAVLLVVKNPKVFLAATVNNKPIFVWDLNSVLQKKYGSEVLGQMIDQMLIKEEAGKQNITVTEKETQDKAAEIEKQVGGKEALDQLITRQGMTRKDLDEQLMLKALVDKILTKNVQVTDKDVEDFLAKNKDTLPATDAASQKTYALESVKQQKLSEAFQKWYTDLKNKAKVYKFF